MGLRTASVRHPNAVVMAPALTETAQPQNFKLRPTSRPASPIHKIDDVIDGNTYYMDNTVSIKSPINNCTLKTKQHNNVFDNLNTLALVSELLKTENTLGINTKASDFTELQTSIMNIPMEDQQEKMGIQKAGLDNVSALLKNKSVNSDMDQILNNLTSELPVNDSAGDMGNNVDDILQVIKSMEGSSERATSDLGGEADSMFPLNTNDLANNLEIFNDVMNMSVEEDNTASLKEMQSKELLMEINGKQIILEKRLEFLLRRLRKQQMRDMGQHLSGEVAGVYEHVHRLLKKLKENPNSDIQQQLPDMENSSSCTLEQLNDTVHRQQTPQERLKPISQSSSKNLARKLEMSALLQGNSNSRQRHSLKYFGSGSIDVNNVRNVTTGTITLSKWPQEHKKELQKVSGLLHSEINLVQQELDSEATASSSGGESCDEMQNYSNPTQQSLSIHKRAAWKYETERAAVASRWTWLQAQISDLEYRIRQHGDLHRQIRNNKGSVVLGGSSPPQSIPSSPTTVNGYRGQLPGASASPKTDSILNGESSGIEYQCARTRPLLGFKKRKILQTAGLHFISKKAARPSNIRCGCVPDLLPCAVCTGRADPTYPRDLPEHLSKAERIALLDPCFHSVFSLPEDVSATIHLEAIMKTPEWQQRRSNLKSLKAFSKTERLDKSCVSLDQRPKKLDHRRRKCGRLVKPSAAEPVAGKIKRMRGRRGRHPSINKINKKRQNRTIGQSHSLSGDGIDEEVEAFSNSNAYQKYDSPCSSPLLATQTICGLQKRNRINSYDIDNIVIPYSVAASTRVEKLQYKEILTPKWRIAEIDAKFKVKNNGAVKSTSQDSDAEDLSEEAVIIRHEKCEHDEKKKFLSYLKLPVGYGRPRSHKRTDSRAESSGGNTPDPMSPYPTDVGENLVSPIISPPATPMSSNTDENSMQSMNTLRRRTISQSRWAKEKEIKEDIRCSTPEQIDVPPFEKRLFPLNEEAYDKMINNVPDIQKHEKIANMESSQDSLEYSFNRSDIENKAEYHDSESTESAYGDEDPNDPEWMALESVARDRFNKR